jgi:hypothetical protein
LIARHHGGAIQIVWISTSIVRMYPRVRRDLTLSLIGVSHGPYFQPPIPVIAFPSRRIPCLET